MLKGDAAALMRPHIPSPHLETGVLVLELEWKLMQLDESALVLVFQKVRYVSKVLQDSGTLPTGSWSNESPLSIRRTRL